MLEDFLTSAEVADLTGYGYKHIGLLCRQGKFPNALKKGHTWLIPRSDVEAYEPGPQGFAAHPRQKPGGGKEGR